MCVGSYCKIISLQEGITVRIKPFSDDLVAKGEVPIGTVVTAYVHPQTGEQSILELNEDRDYGDRLKSSLINPKQLRTH